MTVSVQAPTIRTGMPSSGSLSSSKGQALSRLKIFEGLKSFVEQPDPPAKNAAARIKNALVDEALRVFMAPPCYPNQE